MSLNEINLKYIFQNLYDYVIIKYRDSLPKYNEYEDIDILTSDIKKNINILSDIYDKTKFKHKINIVNEFHIHFDLVKHGRGRLTLRFDLYEKFDFKKFSINENIYRLILKNKIYNNIAYIPSLQDDLSLRYCEYIEYKNENTQKIKHLNYVNNFNEKFYKIKENEQISKLNYENISNMYNSIIIWGHGISYTDNIINSLTENIDCNILNIKKIPITNINSFINGCYKEEMINKNHIISKTNYLKNVEPVVMHIF